MHLTDESIGRLTVLDDAVFDPPSGQSTATLTVSSLVVAGGVTAEVEGGARIRILTP